MQLSIKTPPHLTRPLLEKCAVLGEETPSSLVSACSWQCVKWMDMPHAPFHPLNIVQRYYHALGREDQFLLSSKKADPVIERLTAESREKRASEAAERLKKRKALLKKEAPKHLHLKISQGMNDLPQRIKLKAEWLRITANAFVIGCVEGCLEAMDDPMKAFAPPPIVVDFWSVSQAKLRPEPATNALEGMIQESYAEALRERSPCFAQEVDRFFCCLGKI
jgi:hypothetical protein